MKPHSLPEETIFKLNRTRLWLLAIVSLVLAGLGVWFLVIDVEAIARSKDPGILHGIGLLFMVLLGICSGIAIKKLLQSSSGVILNRDGLTDRSSGMAVGFVAWSDVTDVDGYETDGQKFVTVFVRNPDVYMARGTGLRQAMNKANFDAKGTPVIIPVGGLRTDADTLWGAIKAYFDLHGDIAEEE